MPGDEASPTPGHTSHVLQPDTLAGRQGIIGTCVLSTLPHTHAARAAKADRRVWARGVPSSQASFGTEEARGEHLSHGCGLSRLFLRMKQPPSPELVRRVSCRGLQSPARSSILAPIVSGSLPSSCICLSLHLEDLTRSLDAPPSLTTQRIEAFSDGVFAIAITLLVLEIKVPQLQTPTPSGEPLSLRTALFQLWPSYFGYIFSFVMIGIYWANHHYIFHLYRHSDHIFALLNVLFLMCSFFLPFPTAILAGGILRTPPLVKSPSPSMRSVSSCRLWRG
jgi:hypothetical protein